MRVILSVLSFCLLAISTIYSQEVTVNDLQEKILNQKAIIDQLNKQVLYYKETLNLLDSRISTTEKGVDFKINSVVGNLATGEVIVAGILSNNGVVRSLQGAMADSVDPQGNIVTTYAVSFMKEVRIEKLRKDIPVKFKVVFKEIVAGTPMLRELSVKFYSNVDYRTDNIDIVFNNINIEWQ